MEKVADIIRLLVRAASQTMSRETDWGKLAILNTCDYERKV